MIYQKRKEGNDYEFKQVQIRLKEAPALYTEKKVNTPQDAVDVFKDLMATFDREHFIVVCLNTKNRVINFNVVSIGNLSGSDAKPVNVFKPAILSNAAGILLIHNHPSGDPAPSETDIKITLRLQLAGDILGINVLDHIIVGFSDGKPTYYSLTENGCLN